MKTQRPQLNLQTGSFIEKSPEPNGETEGIQKQLMNTIEKFRTSLISANIKNLAIFGSRHGSDHNLQKLRLRESQDERPVRLRKTLFDPTEILENIDENKKKKNGYKCKISMVMEIDEQDEDEEDEKIPVKVGSMLQFENN